MNHCLQVYDPSLGTWSEGPSLLNPRSVFALVASDKKLYAIGGGIGVEERPYYVLLFSPRRATNNTGYWRRVAQNKREY